MEATTTTPTTYEQLPEAQRLLVWAYQRGERSDEAREAWRVYRRDRERARWARLREETGLSNRQLRAERKASRAS